MEASELRIGNFLLCYGKVRQVVEIGLNGFLATSQEGQSFNISGTNYKGMKDEELWQLFLDEAEPEQEFADTSADNREAIIKALRAAYNQGFSEAGGNIQTENL